MRRGIQTETLPRAAILPADFDGRKDPAIGKLRRPVRHPIRGGTWARRCGKEEEAMRIRRASTCKEARPSTLQLDGNPTAIRDAVPPFMVWSGPRFALPCPACSLSLTAAVAGLRSAAGVAASGLRSLAPGLGPANAAPPAATARSRLVSLAQPAASVGLRLLRSAVRRDDIAFALHSAASTPGTDSAPCRVGHLRHRQQARDRPW